MRKLLIALCALPLFAHAKLTVGTTTSDLEALAKEIGGPYVSTFSIVKGTQDPHQIEAKPSYMIKFRDADLIIAQGLELESAWLKPLIDGSRNPRIAMGGRGVLELGESLDPIEVPSKDVTRAQGDVHPGGNPHFQLDPLRMGRAAVLIAERLGELDPSHSDQFLTAANAIKRRLDDKTAAWKKRIAATGITEVVTFHKTLSYFLDRFGIKNSLQLEPKPGIPPTASHLLEVIRQMKERNLKLILIENYFDDSVKSKLSHDIPGLKINRVAVSVGGDAKVNSTDDLIEALVRTFESAK